MLDKMQDELIRNQGRVSMVKASWGDIGGGYYRNPVLYADFSDPDVIRVGDRYYMVASDFHFMGMQILESVDLVNWRYLARVYERLDIDPQYDEMSGYAHGSWAPSLRYHDGRYYVYFCTPGEGLYMTLASDPAGPWAPLHEVCRVENWEDPCPFWDDDGRAYLGHSTWGAGPIIIHKMSADGRTLLDDGKIVYVGKVAEGTKIYKRNDWYYLSIPEGGVATGWQTVLRARDIYGPYEKRIVLAPGQTQVNGPHQGAIVDTPDGEYYFMHFQDRGAIGRVCHLQPLRWVDDWPVIGTAGEPIEVWSKPQQLVTTHTEYSLATSDDFRSDQLGLQWQWNHNPVLSHVIHDPLKGELGLKALPAESFDSALNTLTQKLIGESAYFAVTLDPSEMDEGQIAGLAFMSGKKADYIAVEIREGEARLLSQTTAYQAHGPALRKGLPLKLAATYDLHGSTYFYFKTGGEWIRLGNAVDIRAGAWKGCRPALFTYLQTDCPLDHQSDSDGIARFSNFVHVYQPTIQ